MIQVKDLQFPKYFLLNELDIDPRLAAKLLNLEVEVRYDGEPDTAVFKGNKLVVSQPSSLVRFLFNVLYSIVKNHVNAGFQQDKFALALLFSCKDYTYTDYDAFHTKRGQPPVLVSFNKLPVPATIIDNIIEPLVGPVKRMPVMFMRSNFIDACEVSQSSEKFSKRFRMPFKSVSFHDYPILVANAACHNEAAQKAHIMYQAMVCSFGSKRTSKIIRNIVLSENSNIAANLVEILKILEGDPIYIMDFLKFMKSNVTLTEDEEVRAAEVCLSIVKADQYLSEHIKIAQQGQHTPQVFKQWHQWSMLVGLIEKQLAPMRGSMWPTTQNLKPFEDKHRQMAVERAKEKGKTQLNFEELLELAREWYGHKTSNPGQLAENLLRENRVWK